MRRMNSQQTTHAGARGRSVGGQLAGVLAVNVPRKAAWIAKHDSADDAVDVIFWPRTGQNALRPSATFGAQLCVTNQSPQI